VLLYSITYIIHIKTWSLLIMINIIMSGGYLSVLGGFKKKWLDLHHTSRVPRENFCLIKKHMFRHAQTILFVRYISQESPVNSSYPSVSHPYPHHFSGLYSHIWCCNPPISRFLKPKYLIWTVASGGWRRHRGDFTLYCTGEGEESRGFGWRK